MVDQERTGAWIEDNIVPKFPPKFHGIGPKHAGWKTRVKLEVIGLTKYLEFLKSKHARPWFNLSPSTNPKHSYMIWKGFLTVPERPEISFGIRILLCGEYPMVTPRCFADADILNYCGKIFFQKIWKDPEENNKSYVMICHEHLESAGAWTKDLGIAHFFIRQVWFWWGAQQNVIIQEFDKKKAGLHP